MEHAELTPGQKRTAKARAVLMRGSEEKLAEKLRQRGWTCTPPSDLFSSTKTK